MSAQSTSAAAAPPADATDLIFRALASKPRRQILMLLATGGGEGDARCCQADEVCACVFAEKLGLGAPTISHHMKALADAGLVTAEKRGLWVYYRLVPGAFEPLLDELRTFATAAATGCDCTTADSAPACVTAAEKTAR